MERTTIGLAAVLALAVIGPAAASTPARETILRSTAVAALTPPAANLGSNVAGRSTGVVVADEEDRMRMHHFHHHDRVVIIHRHYHHDHDHHDHDHDHM